ncbi:VanW family protein [Anaerocolumna sp. AGMB13025]|uniref:VanW family protein n=1 Tax=Anaerocolumna sp. AGMB13025 TaxID=3039116 RepID=UPI00241C882B|nr:VanW family protein [Anaerocolumna sp. AGMB13025]WFR57169.1 VanW family protein [Anaerocolumna sp. AGMB13025]
MAKKKNLVTIVLLFVICLFSTAISTRVFAASEDETITKGVYIDSIHIGGMTAEEAKQAVKDYVEDLKSKKINVQIGKDTESISLSKLGYDVKDNDYINQAVMIGKTGNLIKRYKELKDTEASNLVYNLEFNVNDKKIKKFVKDKLSAYDQPSKNASVKRQNGQFVYTDHKVGRKVDVDKTVEEIDNSLSDGWNREDITLSAVVEDDQPKYTTEDVEKVKTKLGTFSTTYTTSSQNRAGNLANGARLINNTVLYPGDVFSAYDKLTPFTTSNGYYEAGAYSNGKVIDSIGGGACQVTTTLYNAVLFSELDIVERYPHSMTISYVDLSRDAAIAGTWKDLKFKNDTKAPILIEAYTSGRTITFNIWGDETRDDSGRKIKFETVVLNEKSPGPDVVTKDPTKPTTYSLTTQPAHTGYSAELYKVVYENGVEVSRTRINKSVYNPSPRYVTIGTKEEEPPVTAGDETPAGDDAPPKDSNNTAGNTDNDTGIDNAENETEPEDEPVWEDIQPGDVPSDDAADGNETNEN